MHFGAIAILGLAAPTYFGAIDPTHILELAFEYFLSIISDDVGDCMEYIYICAIPSVLYFFLAEELKK